MVGRLKGDVEVVSGDNIHLRVNEDMHYLLIDKCSLDCSGLFTVRLRNAAGQISCSGRLKVIRTCYVQYTFFLVIR